MQQHDSVKLFRNKNKSLSSDWCHKKAYCIVPFKCPSALLNVPHKICQERINVRSLPAIACTEMCAIVVLQKQFSLKKHGKHIHIYFRKFVLVTVKCNKNVYIVSKMCVILVVRYRSHIHFSDDYARIHCNVFLCSGRTGTCIALCIRQGSYVAVSMHWSLETAFIR